MLKLHHKQLPNILLSFKTICRIYFLLEVWEWCHIPFSDSDWLPWPNVMSCSEHDIIPGITEFIRLSTRVFAWIIKYCFAQCWHHVHTLQYKLCFWWRLFETLELIIQTKTNQRLIKTIAFDTVCFDPVWSYKLW